MSQETWGTPLQLVKALRQRRKEDPLRPSPSNIILRNRDLYPRESAEWPFFEAARVTCCREENESPS